MARIRRRVGEGPEAVSRALLDKARAVARKVERLKRVAHEAQVREAVSRTELTRALHASLIARAELAARLRLDALDVFLIKARPGRLRRNNRLSQMLDKVLVRLGSFGQAAVIARSGVWRGTGRPLHDLRHMAAYARRGARPDVAPQALFDQVWYLATYRDVAAAGMAPLTHYLTAGHREGRSPHPLFDDAHYRAQQAPALAATSLAPLEHYLRAGWAQGASPHPLFDVAHYAAQAPGLNAGEDLLSHYLRQGAAAGLSPHPLFDPAWWLECAKNAGSGVPLVDYVTGGWRDGIAPHPLVAPLWYAERHPEAAERGQDPLRHFLVAGAAAGFSPSPWFDLPAYVAARGAALPPGRNPLVDYLQGGAWAVLEPRPGFPNAAYMAGYPDLVEAGLTPLEHWARRAARQARA
jgi:hypothetical protein